MDIEQVRKANREKFPDFTQFTDAGFKLLWAKHIDGTEIGRKPEIPNTITLSADSIEALTGWNNVMNKGKK